MTDEENLIISVIEGDIEGVTRLVREGVNVDARDSGGCTAIIYAICMDNPDLLKILINAKGDVNIKANSGKTALMCAASSTNEEVVDMLLNANADINAKSKMEETALWFALEFSNENIIRKLIMSGADVNAVNREGITLIDWVATRAKKYNHLEEIVRKAIAEREDAAASATVTQDFIAEEGEDAVAAAAPAILTQNFTPGEEATASLIGENPQ